MFTTKLRKVGGSVMLTVPTSMLEALQLQSGASVVMLVEIAQGRLADGAGTVQPLRGAMDGFEGVTLEFGFACHGNSSCKSP